MADDAAAISGKKVWLDMDQAALDAAYDQSVWAPNQKLIHARRDALAAEAYARLKPQRFTSGAAPIEGFDFYSCGRSGAPIVAFVHGGAWRSGIARNFAHLGESFTSAGLHCAVLDFSNIDETGGNLMTMAKQVRAAIAWIARNAGDLQADASRIYIAGHSSGAHLSGCAVIADWERDYALPGDVIKAAVLMSGMYDMTPVSLSKRSSYVNFTAETIEELSAIRHLDRVRCPLVLGIGAMESPEFQRQGRDFSAALTKAGKPHRFIVAEATNHYEMLESLHNPFGIYGRAARELFGAG